ncbi:hypothetical protein [Shewanella sp.]|uniref:hypothetical protein n=1 Tax=Shewanella sp. TaxID=50422 RepID=UPI00404795E1
MKLTTFFIALALSSTAALQCNSSELNLEQNLSQTEVDNSSTQKNITLICTTPNCDIQLEIFKYLAYQNIFDNNVEFHLSSGGIIIDSLTLNNFIENNNVKEKYKSKEVKEKKVKNKTGQTDSAPTIGLMDASLNCNNDPDYTCQEWDRNLETARLRGYLNSTTLGVIVDQDLLDSNIESLTWAANAILAVPVTRLINALVALGKDVVYGVVVSSVAAATISDQISTIVAENGLLSLEVGDLIIYTGNGEVVIIKHDAIDNGGTGGGSSGSGSSNSGSNTIVVGGSGSTGESRGVCTGISGELVCYTIYY